MIKKLFSKFFSKPKAQSSTAKATNSSHAFKTSLHPHGATSSKNFFQLLGQRQGDSPTIIKHKQHQVDVSLVSRHALRVCEVLQERGFKAFIVGGAVRDLLLGLPPKDFDVATNATPEEIRDSFRRAFIIGRRFRLVHVMFGSDTIEVSTFRAMQSDTHYTDEHGRILRDNVFGSIQEDAARRDFTINALYYDPHTQEIIDYHGGVADIRKRSLRMIGDPEQRYREDPVRMLRAVRFAAKLQCEIDTATRAPIAHMSSLIEHVPAARLFDEMLKLLMSGHAMACLKRLRHEGLHHGLLPLLDVVLEQPAGLQFVELALANTDSRVRAGKSVSPSFLFAVLLWQQVLTRWQGLQSQGQLFTPALVQAIASVLEDQTEKLAIQRRFITDMRDIWMMQPRLEKRSAKTAYRLLEQPRYRAAYDFLLLRAQTGEVDKDCAQWWQAFTEGDHAEREILIESLRLIPARTSDGTTRKRRRRKSTVKKDLEVSNHSDMTPTDITPS